MNEQKINTIKNWKTAFSDDETGINTNISTLIWNYATFRLILRSILIHNQKRKDSLSPIIFEHIQNGFWMTLIMGVRRLLDSGGRAKVNDVNSIQVVLNQIKASQSWLNRETYMELVAEVPFDYERLRHENCQQFLINQQPVKWGDTQIRISETYHKIFDQWSGIQESQRSPQDLICPNKIIKLENRFKELRHIGKHASKYIAHSATRESREGHQLEDFGIPEALDTLKKIYNLACELGEFVGDGGPAGHPQYQADVLEGFDIPFAQTSDLPILGSYWHEIESEIENWRQQAGDDS